MLYQTVLCNEETADNETNETIAFGSKYYPYVLNQQILQW